MSADHFWKYAQSVSMWAAVPVALRGKVGQLCTAEEESLGAAIKLVILPLDTYFNTL